MTEDWHPTSERSFTGEAAAEAEREFRERATEIKRFDDEMFMESLKWSTFYTCDDAEFARRFGTMRR